MEILVDGEKHVLLHADPGTVGAALLEISQFLDANGRALQRIEADGREVAAEEITQAFGATPITEITTLEITSADTRDLARESLDELAEVVPELPVACQQLAALLSGDTEQEALEGFDNLLEIWAVLKDRQAQVLSALALDSAELQVEDSSLAQRNQDLENQLRSARQARHQMDLATLSDLMSYELAPLAELEIAIIALLKSKL